MTSAAAPAKLNLALVVGPLRPDGKHEVVSVMAPIELADEIELQPAAELTVEGFPEDTLVRSALEALAAVAGAEPSWRVSIAKRIPVASGLGGGSSDAAAALKLANGTLAEPLSASRLHSLASRLGADVPFFLTPGAKVARSDGTDLEGVSLPSELAILLLLPRGVRKSSTADVYRAFDARAGERGFAERAAALEEDLRDRRQVLAAELCRRAALDALLRGAVLHARDLRDRRLRRVDHASAARCRMGGRRHQANGQCQRNRMRANAPNSCLPLFSGLRGELTGSRTKSSATTGRPGRFAPEGAQAERPQLGPPFPSDRPKGIRQVLQAGGSIDTAPAG